MSTSSSSSSSSVELLSTSSESSLGTSSSSSSSYSSVNSSSSSSSNSDFSSQSSSSSSTDSSSTDSSSLSEISSNSSSSSSDSSSSSLSSSTDSSESSSSYSSSSSSSTSSTSSIEWNPKELSGLRLWLDASTIDRANGASIASWTDYSGNSFDATQGTTSYQPTVQNDYQNSKNVLYFDTAEDQYYNSDLPISNPSTVFVVAKALTNATDSYLLSAGNNTTNGMKVSTSGGSASILNSATLTDSAYTYGSMDIFTGIYNETASYIYVNGTYKATGTTGTGTATSMLIGKQYGATTTTWHGYIAEVVVYNRTLTWDEQLLVEDYLAEKWGIEVQYLSSSSSSTDSSDSSSTDSSSSSSSDSSSLSSSSSSSSSASVEDIVNVGNIITRARRLLNDTSSSRWSDSDMFFWITDAIRRVRSFRPDSKLNTDGLLTQFYKITSSTQSIEMDEIWHEAIVNYVVYRCVSEGAEDKISMQRANTYKQLFEENLRI